MTTRIIHTDFLKWLRDYQHIVKRGYMPKFHAVLADPPYFLDSINKRFGKPGSVEAQYGRDGSFQRLGKGFMGKQWDGFDSVWEYQAWVTEWASMLLDFVYPGGVLMMFGGTRTYHRLVCGLEDAGWEIYDSIGVQTYQWVYGSGFPKSHDISKSIDKAAGAEREVVERVRPDGKKTGIKSGTFSSGIDITLNTPIPVTEEAEQWEGYGTALKPSYEPIVLARKPRGNHTYADCALRFGTGALNIDGGRVSVAQDEPNKRRETGYEVIPSNGVYNHGLNLSKRPATLTVGRWPANTILVHHPACTEAQCVKTCHVRVLSEQSGESVSTGGTNPVRKYSIGWNDGYMKAGMVASGANNGGLLDSGTAARFFYNAKSPQWERDAGLGDMPLQKTAVMQGNLVAGGRLSGKGEPIQVPKRRNSHPTIKPVQLTEYLAKLLLPPIENARLLVPFAGSGSEMIGARLAGWQHVTGIEMTDEYIPIAEARIKWWGRFNSYAMAAAHHKNHSDKQMTLFEVIA